ncbi:phosphodiester glycosidase family protein [Streptomyces sp. FZ201]|uniref:phosphodiester glycosidase family protein n=1 Tax=Streptomyces sp. FZ201 TaxID=3057122 RepID=UPI0021BFC61D|nr:phosphodiester glycosidase family protein [Streptomyces sp. FZ201]
MTKRQRRFTAYRTALTLLTALGSLAGAALSGAAPAEAAPRGRIAPGVVYEHFDIQVARGTAHGHLLRVDLTDPHVTLDLLHPGKVAGRAPLSQLARAQGAVAGVNGDFFNISEAQHPGVEVTGAAVGPAVASGRALKAAVPKGQRFGPALPPGTSTRDVIGMGVDRRARLDDMALSGSVRTATGSFPLGGLNQYALPVNSVGAFTADWGSVSRVRATCGTDTNRAAPCSEDTHEVTVKDGRVVSWADDPGRGAIPAGTTVLVGREAGAAQLRELVPGQPVKVLHELVAAASKVAYRFAVGGYPVLTGGQPLPGLDDSAVAVRSAVGIAGGGKRVLLFSLDGGSAYRGLTVAEVAATLRKLGATDAFSLDGGGSSTLVARAPGASAPTVRNHPSGGAERAVPNGIGVFVTP